MLSLRLDPALPVLWRDADTVQFGLDGGATGAAPALTLSVDAPWVTRMLHALARGIPPRGFEVVAHGFGAPLADARRLHDRLRSVLVQDAARPLARLAPAAAVSARVVLRLEEALDEAGVELVDTADAPVLLVQHGAASARDAAPMLLGDRAHLAIAFDPGGSTVGPFVVPGRTPCLSCRDAHDRDRDPAWAALHVQLLERDPGHVPLRAIAAAAEAASAMLAELPDATRSGSGRVERISRDGCRSARTVGFHEDCLCRSPRGIATGAAPRDRRPATTSWSEFARPA